ncbi:MAG: bifunctional class I SAM-dependent methyltransferase/glycosyltransferase family 2 protein [Thermodesulfobacteriota bacterium]
MRKSSAETSRQDFIQSRAEHWDRVSGHYTDASRPGRYYHRMLESYYRFMVPENARVLELGCGHGDLLASLSPSLGVGVDLSEKMVARAREKHPGLTFVTADAAGFTYPEPFDVIILSDLVNDLWDVQSVLEMLHPLCHPGTRIIINFYNNLWKIPLGAVRRLGLGAETLQQSWFSPHDVANMLALSGYEPFKRTWMILLPLPWSSLFNRYLVHFWPFSWMALTNVVVARPLPGPPAAQAPTVSVIVPARNEAGNIENIISRVPEMGGGTEIVFVEGHSTDDTYKTIEEAIGRHPEKKCLLLRQTGKGKGDAVRLGFDRASGDILMILDADLTVPPEDLPRFYDALVSGKGDFINGVRLVYPMEDRAMRFFNMLGNKFFSMAFSWLLGQPVKDTLCGTKVMWNRDYRKLAQNRSYFGDFDPFGDFDLIFGAARMNLKIVDMPIRYRERTYGETNIERWRHGWQLMKMVLFAATRIKFLRI